MNERSPVVGGNQKSATSFGSIAQFDVVEAGTVLSAPQMTTTQRDALTPTNGWIIYNTTDNKVQVRENGSWSNIT
jgi:hypothetical protein|tara:strand:- start:829 stop:1053 length:225 start_codon:yes stop_codon:yes gene_type:complete